MLRIIAVVIAVCIGLSVPAVSFSAGSDPFLGEVNEPDVNVRVDSTVGASVICILRKGERVKVVAEAYDWYRVALPRSAPAYIHKDFVLVTEGETAGKVLKSKVNVRLRPDIGAPILGQVNKGDTVEIVRSPGDWVKIVPPPKATGWVNKNFINRLAAAEKEPAPSQAAPEAQPAGVQTHVQVQEFLVIEGLLKKKFFTRVAPYKLISLAGDLYLIGGDKAELDKQLNKKVTITGVVRTAYDDPPIVDVRKIEPMQL